MNPSLAPILSAAAMRACDAYTIQKLGVPSQVLMERAARAVVSFLLCRRDLFPAGKVLVLCGSGNNGGDGFAAARFFADGSSEEAREVAVVYAGRWADGAPDGSRMSVECARQYALALAAGVPVVAPEAVAEMLAGAACVVDAIFGIGLDRPVEGTVAELLGTVRDSGLPVLAVDIPSGVNADSGTVMGVALPARATVTMQAIKAGLVLYPGADACGELAVADIGIDTAVEKALMQLADETLLRRVLPPRERRSHKGTHGRVLLVCGSAGMSGAAVLCARAALRSGAGLVEVLTVEGNRLVLQTAVPEAIVTVYDPAVPGLCSAELRASERRATLRTTVQRAVAAADVVVAGCGLGMSDGARAVLEAVLASLPRNGEKPLVLDADGLNLLAAEALWEAVPRGTVLTPHPAEMARLCGKTVSEILADPRGTATEPAQTRGVTVVLKDAHTVIAGAAGETYLCIAGSAGMATGGSGDALAGVIGALLAQSRARLGISLTTAAVAAAGVYLHAAAGDLAAGRLGEYGMLPSDLIEALPLVTRDFSDTRTRIESI